MKTTTQLRHQVVSVMLWHCSNCFHAKLSNGLLSKGQNNAQAWTNPPSVIFMEC